MRSFLVLVVAFVLPGLTAASEIDPYGYGTEMGVWADFDSPEFGHLVHGEIANDQISGVTISALNPNRSFDLAVGFDTNARNTSDPDLESNDVRRGSGPFWSAGNLAHEDLGIILILQENCDGCEDGICDDPDDEGRRPAGDLNFDFHTAVIDFAFDLIDIESATAEHATIELFGRNGSEIVGLMEFLDPESERYDPTIVLGDNSANRFQAITAASVGLDEIERVVVHLGGSGGIDNIHANVIPEPSTALLMAFGLGALARRRRRG